MNSVTGQIEQRGVINTLGRRGPRERGGATRPRLIRTSLVDGNALVIRIAQHIICRDRDVIHTLLQDNVPGSPILPTVRYTAAAAVIRPGHGFDCTFAFGSTDKIYDDVRSFNYRSIHRIRERNHR